MKLTRSKHRMLATVSASIVEVLIASFIVPAISGGFDKIRLPAIIFGILSLGISFWLSLLFAEKGKL